MFEINVSPNSPWGIANIGNVPGFQGAQNDQAFAAMEDSAGILRVYDRFADGIPIDEYLDIYKNAQNPPLSPSEFLDNIRVGFPILNGNGGLSPISGLPN